MYRVDIGRWIQAMEAGRALPLVMRQKLEELREQIDASQYLLTDSYRMLDKVKEILHSDGNSPSPVALRNRLAKAERDVAKAKRYLASQETLVATLEWRGHDASEARQLLGFFEEVLEARVAAREQLRVSLAEVSNTA